MELGSYRKFGLMLGVSYIIMQADMYLNVAQFNHIYIGLTRLNMTVLMVAPMALIMLAFMGSMYKNRRINALIMVLVLPLLQERSLCYERRRLSMMSST